MEKLEQIIFYSIDKAIRTYRQFAQQQLKQAGFTMTVDQWLVIKCILQNPEITQQEIAERVFKDNASVTRIIALLVREKYLSRRVKRSNRRRMILQLTDLGKETISEIDKIVLQNRKTALAGIALEEIETTRKVMEQITLNCNSQKS